MTDLFQELETANAKTFVHHEWRPATLSPYGLQLFELQSLAGTTFFVRVADDNERIADVSLDKRSRHPVYSGWWLTRFTAL